MHFLQFFIWLIVLFSYGSAEIFYKIYENKENGKIRGITNDELSLTPILAIATEKNLIFGNIEENNAFTELSKMELTKKLTGECDILEFKFISYDTVIICNNIECRICVNNYECTTIASFLIKSVNAQKTDKTLFLRVVHEIDYAAIYSFKSENGTFERIGMAIDWTSDIHEFKSLYSFSHENHAYFITEIKREDLAVSCFFTERKKNITFFKTDIVITQICDNDQSDEIITRMDLTLSCGEMNNSTNGSYAYGDRIYRNIYQNNVKGVTYLHNLKRIFATFQDSPFFSFMCDFDFTQIEAEFCKTWNFCQAVPETYEECVNRENTCIRFSDKDVYPLCETKYSDLNIKNECDASIYSNMQKIRRGKQSYTTIFGDTMKEEFYRNNYGAVFSSNKQLFISATDKLTKMGNSISHFLEGVPKDNDKMLSLWDIKNGIVYVDPATKNTIYLKDIVCNDTCIDILHSTNVICNLCDEKYLKTCIYEETEIYCGPLWQNIDMQQQKFYDQEKRVKYETQKFTIIYKGAERRMDCFPSKEKKPEKCIKVLDEYLTPFFTAPLSAYKPIPFQFTFLNIAIIASLSVAGILIVLCILIACLYSRYKRKLRKNRKGRKPYMDALINKERLIILQKLGFGNSGFVNLGEYTNGNEVKKVAVKTLQCSKADVIKEIEALSSCNHGNVASFIGWLESDDEMKIIIEYMSGGDLHSYLINPNKLLMVSTIFSYIFQTLDAMIYLSHKHILHRDLAARNCLLNETYETLKISDFGLAREMNIDYEYIPETNRALPFRWLPLETIRDGKFTLKSDIWSFGVLIWEIFERGAYPYNNLTFNDVLAFIECGKRLVCPEHCPLELYTVMLWCWDKNPWDRPNFDAIKDDIKAVHSHLKLYESERLNITIETEGYEVPKSSKS